MTLTPEAIMLISMMVNNAISAIMNEIAEMTPEEIEAATVVEEARSKRLMDKIKSH